MKRNERERERERSESPLGCQRGEGEKGERVVCWRFIQINSSVSRWTELRRIDSPVCLHAKTRFVTVVPLCRDSVPRPGEEKTWKISVISGSDGSLLSLRFLIDKREITRHQRRVNCEILGCTEFTVSSLTTPINYIDYTLSFENLGHAVFFFFFIRNELCTFFWRMGPS